MTTEKSGKKDLPEDKAKTGSTPGGDAGVIAEAVAKATKELEEKLRVEQAAEVERVKAELRFQHQQDMKRAAGMGATRPRHQELTTVGVKVRATALGYYDNKRWRPGDVFIIAAEDVNTWKAKVKKDSDGNERSLWPPTWVEEVRPETPLAQTTSKQALRREHDEILGGSVRKAGPDAEVDAPTGGQEVLVGT